MKKNAMFDEYDGEIAAGAAVPVIEDDLQHHARGCYTAHSEIKRMNRRVEHQLMNAERLAARHEVTWHWVRGHNGHPENERADALARGAIVRESA